MTGVDLSGHDSYFFRLSRIRSAGGSTFSGYQLRVSLYLAILPFWMTALGDELSDAVLPVQKFRVLQINAPISST